MKIKHLLILILLALVVPLAANAQSSLPFSENFNSVPVDQLPTNWVLSPTHIGEVAAVVQKETSTSINRILVMGVTQLQNGNGALAVQIPANAIGKYYVKLTFKLMPTKATSGTFKVIGASTSFSNPIDIATYNASDLNVGSWNYITVPVALPSSKTITFMVTTTTANTGWAIDDVSVTDGYKPTNVTTSVLEPNYATISWDYSGTSSYEMRYHMQGETDWTTVTPSSNHYAISELLTNTTYEAQVRGVEGSYYTGWSDLLTFTTPDAFYNFYIAIQNSDRYLYYKVTDSENHYVTVVPPFNSFGDPWGTFAKPEGNVIIPQTVTYGGVTYTVTEIGNYALKGCTGVTGISIPSTVTSIGNYAFYNCKLTSVVIPSSVTEINQYAFSQCGDDNGMTVNIAGNATTGTRIETMAFLNSKVSELTLGEGVTFVGDKAFWSCPLLTTVHFNATNCTQMRSTYNSAYYSVFNSGSDNTTHPAITALTIGNNVTNIPDYAFYDFTSLTEVTISEGVSSIGNQAFWNCPNLATVNFNATNCTNMKTTLNSVSYSSFNSGSDNTTNPAVTTLNIGNNVTNIPDYAFYGFTSLPEVTISEGVTSIGERAFWKCPNLTTVHFNATNCTNMKTTYYYVLRSPFNSGTDNTTNPAIITLTIGSNVTRIPEYAFYGADQITTGLIIPSSVQYIEECAFKSCSHIPSLVFENGSQLESIDEEAFNYCDDMSGILRLPNSLTEIGYWSFSHCGFWKVVIPSSVTSIAASAFNSCGSSMVVEIAGNPTSGTTIGNYAFYNSDIVELTIGEGVISIGEQAFWKCPNLTTVHFNAINCTNMMTTYNNGTSDLSLSPFNSGDDENSYPAITTLTIGDNVTRIPKYAFYHANSISNNLIIPSSVQYIEESAFAYCKKISGLSFAEDAQLVSIGTSAFYYCERIKGTLRFPNSLTEIGGWAFCLSGLLSKIIIPSSVTSIGTSAFNSCNRDGYQVGYGLIVEIAGNPTSGTTIWNNAFRNSDIVELTIGDGVTSIGNGAFWNCQYLTTVHFNAVNCTSMKTTYTDGDNTYYRSAFNSGEDLTTGPVITTLTIGENVTNIPGYAFYDCQTASVQLNIPNVTAVGDGAFYNCLLATDLNLGNSVVTIGMKAFENCNNITGDLIIPNTTTFIGASAFCDAGLNGMLVLGQNVNSLGAAAFKNCNFTSIIIGRGNVSEPNNITTAEANTFEGVRSYIPVYRPFGTNYPTATGWNYFTNYLTEYQHNGGAWSAPANWSQQQLPGTDDVVFINGNSHISANESHTVKYLYIADGSYQKLTIRNNAQLTVTDGLLNNDATKLVIDDGGQLFASSMAFEGTAKRSITGYETASNPAGWYTIASPFKGGSVDQVTTGNYDLYTYDEPTSYWLNQKVASHHIDMFNPKKGYLYANQATTEIALRGTFDPSDTDLNSATVKYTAEAGNQAGFNLLGNPYTHNINIGDVTMGGDAFTQYYTVRGGSGLMAYTASDNQPIKVCEGFFVKVTSNGTVNFNGATRGERADDSYLRLVLYQGEVMSDRAYLRMNDGQALEKLAFGERQSLLYFKEGNSSYAIAPYDAYGTEMPLFFEPASNGTYTIAAAMLNAECDYCHLIDNLTGADVDLLATPSYTFEANTHNYAARFELVFDKNANNSDKDDFAFIYNGNIIVNGTGTVQVIDILGRQLFSHEVNSAFRIPHSEFPTGVYVLRLIDGDKVKTQKVIKN